MSPPFLGEFVLPSLLLCPIKPKYFICRYVGVRFKIYADVISMKLSLI